MSSVAPQQPAQQPDNQTSVHMSPQSVTNATVKMPSKLATTSIAQPLTSYSVEKPIEAITLNDENLKVLWDEALSTLGNDTFVQAANDCQLTLVDQNNFKITTHNIFFERDYNGEKTAILTYIRKKSGHVHLNSTVNVLMEKAKKQAYTPTEKFEAMLQKNASLGAFRLVFTDIDF